jgi:5-dehydro-2-deoxygluconokinase
VTQELFILAFDHKEHFEQLVCRDPAQPTDAEMMKIREAKALVHAAVRQTISGGLDRSRAGILIDERYGAELARAAAADGLAFAMPVERPDQQEFDFLHQDWQAHIDWFDPTFAKAILWYNVEADADLNRRQLQRMRTLVSWLRGHDRQLMLEVVVPPTPRQLEQLGDDRGRFDRQLRPALMVAALEEIQRAGIEPDLWKLEGVDRRQDCERIGAQARAGGEGVGCLVLGRGEDEQAVAHWLACAGGVPGFRGFAVGRTIWFEPVRAWLAGRVEGADAVGAVARNYRRMIDAFAGARVGAHPGGRARQPWPGRADARTADGIDGL